MKDLLPIGKLSKITGVGIKALRYYEKIGILDPVYINTETSYRYYDISQVKDVNVISECVALGIDLKSLKSFQGRDGRFDMIQLLMYGKENAQRRLREAQLTSAAIDDYLYEINRQAEVQKLQEESGKKNTTDHPQNKDLLEGATYEYRVPKHYILIDRREVRSMDLNTFTAGIAQLIKRTEELGSIAFFRMGFVNLTGMNEPTWNSFIEIHPPPAMDDDVMYIEEALCTGMQVQADTYKDAFSKAKEIAQTMRGPITVTEVWDEKLEREGVKLEVLLRKQASA